MVNTNTVAGRVHLVHWTWQHALLSSSSSPALGPWLSCLMSRHILDKHTRILTQCLRQRALTKVTARKRQERHGTGWGDMEVVVGDSNNNLYSCWVGIRRWRWRRRRRRALEPEADVGEEDCHHLMLTRVSQQQTKCPISVQILKVLLCNLCPSPVPAPNGTKKKIP